MGKKKSVTPPVINSKRVKPVNTFFSDDKLTFSFVLFEEKSINIKDFNNFYKDSDDYIYKISAFLPYLKQLSEYSRKNFVSDGNFRRTLHIHSIDENKLELLKKILKAYNYNDDRINDVIEGEQIYQMECYGSGSSVRIIFQLIDNTIYPLFFDNNHHIYPNKSLSGESMKYKYSVYERGEQEEVLN